MSERTKDIRGMIIPLERCPQVYEQQSLDDAITLFSSVPSERYPVPLPVLLVLDQEDNLVGRLTRNDILRGLVPSILKRSRGKTFFWQKAEYPHLTYLYEDHVLDECGGNRTRPIRNLMQAVDLTLPVDTHLLEAMVVLHDHHSTCVPVTEDGAVIGLLRYQELFHALCNTWCTLPQERGTSSPAENK